MFNCSRNYQIGGVDETPGGGNWDYIRVDKTKSQHEGHESESRESHSLINCSTALTPPHTLTSETGASAR